MDPIISLAVSINSQPGAYALLLGSGVSRAAHIPTGWEVTTDLIEKIATASGDNTGGDPSRWYEEKFRHAPEYSLLLDQLSKTPSERAQLLKSYFEPTPEEREDGRKMPTDAHRAIARLMAANKIRVVVTTNFDRLLEKALEDEGVTPTIISSADMAKGAPPLVHTKHLIFKVHGDYLDQRIKNTADELSKYEPEIDQWLDRIIDEFGLVVCGWSSEWDMALRAAIERSPNRRYTTYWAYRGNLTESAQELIHHRQAREIEITDANSFFIDLEEKVKSLDEYSRPHPLSTELAVSTLKRYLANKSSRIQLHDLIVNETIRSCDRIKSLEFDMHKNDIDNTEAERRIHAYESTVEILTSLFAYGCYWSNDGQINLWHEAMQRIAESTYISGSGYEHWLNLQDYPVLLLQYAGGISSIKRNKYKTYKAITADPTVSRLSETSQLLLKTNIVYTLDESIVKKLPGYERKYLASSLYLRNKMRVIFKTLIPSNSEFNEVFDRFEFMNALTYMSLDSNSSWDWAPLGYYTLPCKRLIGGTCMQDTLSAEIAKDSENWPPLSAGLFNGTLDELTDIFARHGKFISEVRLG